MRLDTAHLHKHYGYMFMSDSKWLANFVSSLQYDEYLHGPVSTVHLGFSYPRNGTFHGLPERSTSFNLQDGHYRMYAVDIFPHEEWNPQGLYSGLPYLQAHGPALDMGTLWANSAETWVDLAKG